MINADNIFTTFVLAFAWGIHLAGMTLWILSQTVTF